MKKLLLAIIAAGSVASAQAQAPKEGSILIYGNVGYNSTKSTFDPGTAGIGTSETKSSGVNINPGVGYQFNKNWTVGLNFNYNSIKTENDDTLSPVSKTRDMEIGPFIRYTNVISNTFFFYNQLNLGYLSGRTAEDYKAPASDMENTYNGFGVSWFPAIGISVNNCVALNFSFGGINYRRTTWDIDGSPAEIKNSDFGITLGQQANIGISVNLGSRRAAPGSMEPGSDTRRLDTVDDDNDD